MRPIFVLSWWLAASVHAAPVFECPRTPEALGSARQEIAALLARPDAPPEREKHIAEIQRCLATHAPTFGKYPRLRTCYANILPYVTDFASPNHDITVSPKAYAQAVQPFVEVPADLQTPQFFAALQTANFPTIEAEMGKINSARRAAGAPGVAFVPFQSVQKTLDGTKGRRIMVYVPGVEKGGESTEQWINFTVPDDPDMPAEQVSVVATHRKAGVAHSYYGDHTRETGLQGTHLRRAADNPTPAEVNCLDCHRSGGPLTLHPKTFWVPSTPAIEANWATFNSTAGRVGISVSKHHNPSFVESGRPEIDFETLPPEFFEACLKSQWKKLLPATFAGPEQDTQKAAVIQRLRRAMTCQRCHNGSQRTRIAESSVTMTERLIKLHVMPPQGGLTPLETRALLECYVWNYFATRPGNGMQGMLYYHLLGAPCPDKPIPDAGARGAAPARKSPGLHPLPDGRV